ncbi:MAG: hypothetical protein IKG82_15105 [Oscillospiraceae bacterium]|nr:hypothetical protein [Oscillospiraceae bacterium]
MDSYHNEGATYSNEEIIPEEKAYASFSELYKDKIINLSENGGRTIKTREIAQKLSFDYEQLRKYINARDRKTNKRDCIIAICALIGCDAEETNEGLRLYGFPELDQYHRRDEIIWDLLAEPPDAPVSVEKINEALAAEHNPLLDIHDYRNKEQTEQQKSPFKLVRRYFQCTIEGIGRVLEPDRFLDLQYDAACYCNMRTCFEYLGKGRRFELCIQYEESHSHAPENIWQTGIRRRICPRHKKYIVYAYPTEELDSELHEFDRMDAAGEFRECFLEIEKKEHEEKKRLYERVNDTRNYGKRMSAGVIENELHVFCETYNSDIPELSEYYLMDYCCGEYTLYVLNRSCFMQMYLTGAQYEQVYGKQPAFRMLHLTKIRDEAFAARAGNQTDPVHDQYSSEEEIEDSAYEARDIGTFETYGENALTALRLKAYRQMKSEINALIEKLKNGTAHICSRELLGEQSDSLIAAYFGLPDLEENGAEYTPEQFRDAFELGLRMVDEIGAFLQTNGSLKINDVLSAQESEGAERDV